MNNLFLVYESTWGIPSPVLFRYQSCMVHYRPSFIGDFFYINILSITIKRALNFCFKASGIPFCTVGPITKFTSLLMIPNGKWLFIVLYLK